MSLSLYIKAALHPGVEVFHDVTNDHLEVAEEPTIRFTPILRKEDAPGHWWETLKLPPQSEELDTTKTLWCRLTQAHTSVRKGLINHDLITFEVIDAEEYFPDHAVWVKEEDIIQVLDVIRAYAGNFNDAPKLPQFMNIIEIYMA